ncbi:hypothetical protein BDP81DRAFT_437394 [Colletotrichum phormii]|uniref:Secreted protein n=1 Tax=Colletotrichum phormii TaxID=359342 RepID=A0AAI9ZJN2_9PEZI|nr:uncharacterized protein BDP81DRAFT_437394 [Colletotrichum phormii]KAK1624790.1 hypothetical protein BDP81DRAFT_437394 [Colletotrichum phormii]
MMLNVLFLALNLCRTCLSSRRIVEGRCCLRSGHILRHIKPVDNSMRSPSLYTTRPTPQGINSVNLDRLIKVPAKAVKVRVAKCLDSSTPYRRTSTLCNLASYPSIL